MIRKLLLKYRIIVVVSNIKSYTEKEKQILAKVNIEKVEDYFTIQLIDGSRVRKSRRTIKFIDYEKGIEVENIENYKIENTFMINKKVAKAISLKLRLLIILTMILYFFCSLLLLNNKENIAFYGLSVITVLAYIFINKLNLRMKLKVIDEKVLRNKYSL